MIDAITAAVQKARPFQIRQKTVHSAHREAGAAGNFLSGEATRRFAEELQQTQPSLQRCDVVTSFRKVPHRHSTEMNCGAQNENANYLMKVRFMQDISLTINYL